MHDEGENVINILSISCCAGVKEKSNKKKVENKEERKNSFLWLCFPII